MSSIFISHSSKDNELAKELERELAKQNHSSVFLDIDPEKGIIGGQSWERTLYRKLRACKAVIALVTDPYLASSWCFAEIALARMEGKPIFALKVEGLSDGATLPSILTENQYISMQPDPAQGYNRLWLGLKEIDLIGVSGDWNPNEPPYLGLNAFHEKHAPVFFGREDESRAGVELLERGSPNLIMTLGGSGSGKSSLVRAGILPRLRSDPDRWLIIEPFRPGSNPFMEMAGALVRSYRRYAPDGAARVGTIEELAQRLELSSERDGDDLKVEGEVQALTDDERVQRLMNQLQELQTEPPDNAHGKFLKFLDWSLDDLKRIVENPGGLALNISTSILIELAEDLRRVSNHPHARVLLVIDQFEESLARQTAEPIMDKFLYLLRVSLETEHSPLMALGTMRSDFLSRFQHSPELRGIDFESLSLGPMRIDGIRRVIEEPAKLAAIELEDGLADRLIADTGSANALPLLSFTLWKLWRDYRKDGLLEIKEYEMLGGLDGAIASEADGLLKIKEEAALRNAFLGMVRLTEDGVYARQPLHWDSEVLKPVHDTLEKFIERRLLVSYDNAGTRFVEVAHESLFYAWAPLKDWLEQDRAELLLKQELRRDTKTWNEQAKSRDYLWRGTRLQQAKLMLNKGELDKSERHFLQVSGRRQALWRLTIALSGVAVFITMAVATYLSQQAKQEAVAAHRKTEKAFINILASIDRYLSSDSVPGVIIADTNVLRVSGDEAEEYTLVRGHYGSGRVMALAHSGAISDNNKEGKIFLGAALAWAGVDFEEMPKIVYSVGHCEIVSDADAAVFRLPMEELAELEYKIEPMANLSQMSEVEGPTILIVGGAWASFSTEEINAVEHFVKVGGAVLIAGLKWSWDEYKEPNSAFNPCTFAPHSSARTKEQVNYPINELARPFGIQWLK